MSRVVVSDGWAKTVDLSDLGRDEVVAYCGDGALESNQRKFVDYFARIALQQPNGLKTETIYWYGFWAVRFARQDAGLVAQAMATDGGSFEDDIANVLACWVVQHDLCETLGTVFDPPRSESTAAVSAGVMSGLKAEGRRFPSSGLASGWFIVADDYDGNPETAQRVHLTHLAGARPDLIPVLALPDGAAFSQSEDGSRVWLEET